jgi:hypothetical protein
MQEMWKEPYRVWLPHGPEDSDLALVSVDPIDAEYLENRGMNGTEYVLNRRKPRSKGERPDVGGMDQHGKTNL